VLGDAISGLDAPLPAGVEVFQGGTKRQGGAIVTAGGRVLTVCAQAPSLPEAIRLAYQAAAGITFAGRQLRTDIAAKAP
jgi:phosphoribosylamine--glycine ligase